LASRWARQCRLAFGPVVAAGDGHGSSSQWIMRMNVAVTPMSRRLATLRWTAPGCYAFSENNRVSPCGTDSGTIRTANAAGLLSPRRRAGKERERAKSASDCPSRPGGLGHVSIVAGVCGISRGCEKLFDREEGIGERERGLLCYPEKATPVPCFLPCNLSA